MKCTGKCDNGDLFQIADLPEVVCLLLVFAGFEVGFQFI